MQPQRVGTKHDETKPSRERAADVDGLPGQQHGSAAPAIASAAVDIFFSPFKRRGQVLVMLRQVEACYLVYFLLI